MSTKALVSTVALAAAMGVPAAEAHTLSKATATRVAAKSGHHLARSVGGSPVYDCTRRSGHAFVCTISLVTADGAVCATRVRVAYRHRRGRSVSRRALSGPTCEPPGLPGVG